MALAYMIFGDKFNEETNKVYGDFKKFVLNDGVAAVAAGVVIGLATYTFARCASVDVLMPLIDTILFGGIRFIHRPTGMWLSQIFKNIEFHWRSFIQELITWITTLFATSVVLQVLLQGVSPTYDNKRKTNDSEQPFKEFTQRT